MADLLAAVLALMEPDEAAKRLDRLASERGHSLAELSRLIGRNSAYLQQFVTRRSPRRLGEDDRLALAQYLGVDERELGAREPWSPPGPSSVGR